MKHKQSVNFKESNRLEKRKFLYKIQSMDLSIEERKTRLIFKRFIYIIISISTVTSFCKYINDPNTSWIPFSCSTISALLTQIPKNILDVFKKPPP